MSQYDARVSSQSSRTFLHRKSKNTNIFLKKKSGNLLMNTIVISLYASKLYYVGAFSLYCWTLVDVEEQASIIILL